MNPPLPSLNEASLEIARTVRLISMPGEMRPRTLLYWILLTN